jgi:hypothetical protein
MEAGESRDKAEVAPSRRSFRNDLPFEKDGGGIDERRFENGINDAA